MNMTEPNQFKVARLSDKAMLVKLKIRRAALVKHDAALSRQIQASEGDTSLNVTTSLFRNKSQPIAQIMQAVNDVYKYHTENTLPYEDAGPRLLPSDNYFEYTTDIRQKIAVVDGLLARWIPHYDQLVLDDIAYRNNGATQRACVGDYPSAADFQRRMGLDLTFKPLPDEQHPLFDVSEEDKASYTEHLHSVEVQARNDVVGRMLKPLEYLVGRLGTYTGAKGERFHQSTLENVLDGCKMARKLAIDASPELLEEIAELERVVKGYVFNVEGIKSDEDTRAAARTKLEAASRKLGDFFA